MSDGGGGPAENYAGPEVEGATSEGVSEAAREKLQEELRKAASDAKKAKRDEGRARVRDDRLVKIIMQFLYHAKKRKLALLITRLLGKNVPVTFILSVLSLNFPEITEILSEQLSHEKIEEEDLLLSKEGGGKELTVFTDKMMKRVDEWGNEIFKNASVSPLKHLRTLATHDGVDLTAIQLTAFVLRDFLLDNKVEEINFEDIQSFSEFILKGVLKKLHELAEGQGVLTAPKEEDKD